MKRMLQGMTQLLFLIHHSANQDYDARLEILIPAEPHVLAVASERAVALTNDHAGGHHGALLYVLLSLLPLQSTRGSQHQSW